MKIKTALAAIVATAALALTGCTTTYSFEADPQGPGGSEDFEGDPTKIECFVIEADGPTDDEDIDLGTFCRVDNNRD